MDIDYGDVYVLLDGSDAAKNVYCPWDVLMDNNHYPLASVHVGVGQGLRMKRTRSKQRRLK